jgi:hypothetical protein
MSLARDDLHGFTDEQRRQVAAGLNRILSELGYPEQEISDWWNLVAFPELDGRTPTQAWLDGDYGAVRDLIEGMYATTAESLARLKGVPGFTGMVDRHRREHSS